jgi:hypothetical protein
MGLRKPVLKVHCYSGSRADERPTDFEWLGLRHRVEAILDRWVGPDHRYFKVRSSRGGIYLLRHDERADRWDVERMKEDPREGTE